LVTLNGLRGVTFGVYFDNILVGSFPITMSTTNYNPVKFKSLSLNNGNLQNGYFSFDYYNKYGYLLAYSGNICGWSYNLENRYIFKINAEHNSSSIKIVFKIISGTSKGDWGIRNLYYFVWSKAIPTTCLPSCTTCNDLKCYYCGSPYLVQDNVCVTSCLSNYNYDSTNKKCFSCHSSCADCFGDDPDSCLSCNLNYFLFGTSCLKSCPIGNFADATARKCQVCSPNCLVCNGINLNNCISCLTSFFFSSGSCVPNCPLNQFLNISNSSCTNCDITCQTCNGPLLSQCTSCISGRYYSKGNCGINCPNDQFLDVLNSSCVDCDSSCLTCNGLLSNECTSCPLPALFSNGICIGSCPLNQYLNYSHNLCIDCDLKCHTCSGPLSSQCCSCPPNTYFSNGNCLINCQSKQFLNVSNNSCVDCDISCLTCNGLLSNNCTSCPLSAVFSYGECVDICFIDQYFIASNLSCGNCDINCKTCSGPFSSDCTSCPIYTYFSNGNCVNGCPSNQFLKISNYSCDDCDISCLTCTGSLSNECTSCQFSTLFSYGVCLSSCPSSQYLNNSNQSCIDCDLMCQTCNGPLMNNCTSCPLNTYFSNGNCVNGCPSNQFLKISNSSCGDCDISCLTCTGPLSNDCTSCPLSSLFSYGGCVSNCASSQYLNASNQSCIDCDLSCQKCDGPFSFDCTSCPLTKYYSRGSCVQNCLFNEFINISEYSCNDYKVCPSHQYLDIIQNLCFDCDTTCESCFAASPKDCSSCGSNTFLYQTSCVSDCPINYHPINFTHECANCLPGYYFESSNFSCVGCDLSCLTCIDSFSTNCTSCSAGKFFFDSECILQCPSHYYNDSTNNSCLLCDKSCFECNGSYQNNCLSCYPDFKLNKNVCLHNVCPSNEFWDKTDFICQNCNPLCKSCFGSQANNCLSCLDGFVFKTDRCIQIQNVSVSVIVLDNPSRFILSFSNESLLLSNLFFENLNDSLAMTISNYDRKLFNYSIERINHSNYSLNITYFDNLIAGSSYLEISLNNSIDNTLNLFNNSFRILLNSYILCQVEDYYYENASCLLKIVIDYNWMYTTKFNVIKLVFKVIKNNPAISNNSKLILDPIITEGIPKGIFYVSPTNNENISYTFQINTDSVNIVFNYTVSTFVKQRVLLYQNVSKWFELKNSQMTRLVKKKLSITIMNEYLSNDEANVLESTKKLTENGDIATTILIYLSYASSPKSTFAIRGILLTNLIQMLKFVTVIYPLNAKIIFFPDLRTHYFIKNDVFSIKPIDLLLNGLPQNFLFYDVSLYVLNNILDTYIFILIILVVCIIFNQIHCQNIKKCQKLFQYLRSTLVWNFVIMISFSKYLQTVFFVWTALRFGFFFDKINTLVSLGFFVYIILITLHYLKIIVILNQLEDKTLKKKLSLDFNCIPKSAVFNEKLKKSHFFKNISNNVFSQPETEIEIQKKINWESLIEPNTPYLKKPDSKNDLVQNVDEIYDAANLESKFSSRCDTYPNKVTPDPIKRNKMEEINSSKMNIRKTINWETFMQYNTPYLKNSDSKKDLLENVVEINESKFSISDTSSNKVNRDMTTSIKLPSSKKNKITPLSCFKNYEMDKKFDISSSYQISSKDLNGKIQKNISNKMFHFLEICFAPFSKLHDSLYKIKDEKVFTRKYTVFKREFKGNFGLQQYYFFIDLVRYFSVPTIIVLLYGYPLIQMTMLVMINLLFLLFVLFGKPFKLGINNFFSFINELCIICAFLSVFFLSIYDLNEDFNIISRINLGWLLVFSYIFLLFSLILNSILRIVRNLLVVFRICCLKKKNQITNFNGK